MSKPIMLAALLIATPALADEQMVTLTPGAGQATVEQSCAGCHSLDYVRMNAPFLTADGWKAEVAKMRSAFGAPIDDEDAAAIQTYLAQHYGPPAP